MTPLRIALIASNRHPIRQPFAGGLEAHVWHLAHALGKDGHEVTLFAAPGSDPELPASFLEVPSFELSELARSDVSMPPADGFLGDHHAYLSLMLDLAGPSADAFDVVHNHSLHYLPIAMARSLRTPLLCTLHTPPTPWLESAMATPGGCPGTFVAVSRHTATAWEHATPGPVTVVPNGVDLGAWPVGSGGEDLIWFGRLVPEKGAHLAIEAARRAGYRHPGGGRRKQRMPGRAGRHRRPGRGDTPRGRPVPRLRSSPRGAALLGTHDGRRLRLAVPGTRGSGMIGYYIHHHGHGHRTRASSICAHLRTPVTALSSVPLGTAADAFDDVVLLPRDDLAVDTAQDPTAHDVPHWVPTHDDGLRERMHALGSWIAATRPSLLVVDVSVEVTLLARLYGIPVVVLAMPGERTDTAHTLAYSVADHLVAPWSQDVYDPHWLRRYPTSYVGGISRFDGRPSPTPVAGEKPKVLVMSGSGGSSITVDDLHRFSSCFPQYEWEGLGVAGGPWIDDPWPVLTGADVVIGHAGQNTVADIAAAARPAVVIAEPRPFDEQHSTATALDKAGLAVGLDGWPDPDRWPELIERARGLDPVEWKRWQVDGAAGRAAAIVDELAERS